MGKSLEFKFFFELFALRVMIVFLCLKMHYSVTLGTCDGLHFLSRDSSLCLGGRKLSWEERHSRWHPDLRLSVKYS